MNTQMKNIVVTPTYTTHPSVGISYQAAYPSYPSSYTNSNTLRNAIDHTTQNSVYTKKLNKQINDKTLKTIKRYPGTIFSLNSTRSTTNPLSYTTGSHLILVNTSQTQRKLTVKELQFSFMDKTIVVEMIGGISEVNLKEHINLNNTIHHTFISIIDEATEGILLESIFLFRQQIEHRIQTELQDKLNERLNLACATK